jgi:hypothetical protein
LDGEVKMANIFETTIMNSKNKSVEEIKKGLESRGYQFIIRENKSNEDIRRDLKRGLWHQFSIKEIQPGDYYFYFINGWSVEYIAQGMEEGFRGDSGTCRINTRGNCFEKYDEASNTYSPNIENIRLWNKVTADVMDVLGEKIAISVTYPDAIKLGAGFDISLSQLWGVYYGDFSDLFPVLQRITEIHTRIKLGKEELKDFVEKAAIHKEKIGRINCVYFLTKGKWTDSRLHDLIKKKYDSLITTDVCRKWE